MKTGWKIFTGIVGCLFAYQSILTLKEYGERHGFYGLCRSYCQEVGKPLLVVGMKRTRWDPPNGDVTVDIDPAVLEIPGGVMADERELPFENKTFGAVYNAHTLEHMNSISDMEMAVNECIRVADKAVFLCPSPYSIIGNFFCPAHHLRIWFDQENNTIRVTENVYNYGLGIQGGGQYEKKPVNQSLVSYSKPKIIYQKAGYLISKP